LLVTSVEKSLINLLLLGFSLCRCSFVIKHSVGNNIQKYFAAGPAGAKQNSYPADQL